LDQLLDAVGYAHEQGVIHRDIKPDNIFVGADGRVKLADFGIARVDGAAATQATVVGAVLGTPGYMSPEQARGAKVDARSDLFSTGVVAYEMLSGRNPFGADGQTDSTTLIYRIVHEPVPELPAPKIAYDGMDADLRPAIMAALEKDPADRPQTAAAFKAMLHGGRTADAFQQARRRPTESGLATRKDSASAKRPKWLPSALVAGVLAVAVGVLFVSANAGGGPVGGASAGKSAYYLGISNNKVALFNGGSNELVEETDIQADTLGADDAAALGNRIAFESIEKAEQQISEFRGQAAKGAVPPVFTSFTASSVSTADTIDAYGPQMAMDGNAKTAWNTDGESVGDGTGQWMQLAASDPQRVSGISILPGFCKDRDTWAKNRRPHAITVSFSDGSSFSAELADKYNKYQELSLPAPVDTTFVRITVDSTYAPTYSGRCYDDCTISEIRIS
ncbi:MAG TPA: hypothetical protein DCP91_07745, partial [Eggerthellaceae bacterium]|nr:hypothetical protein [Eggerthellaceae bacterium]